MWLFLLGGIEVLNANGLSEIVKGEIKNMVFDKVFLLRYLFMGYEWNRISRMKQLLLGILFLDSTDIGVASIEKTSSEQQKYQMTNYISSLRNEVQ